jgi:hypothetical protein
MEITVSASLSATIALAFSLELTVVPALNTFADAQGST